MKKLAIIFGVVLVIGVAALPAAATTQQPVGPPINVLTGTPTTFPAKAPFHIEHGWGLDSSDDAVGKLSFALEVDDTYRAEDFVLRNVITGKPDVLSRIWVFNFPSGMTGTHTFVGHWLAPCYVTAGPCSNPTAIVEIDRHTLTVTFS
jgi:hypothetical protein